MDDDEDSGSESDSEEEMEDGDEQISLEKVQGWVGLVWDGMAALPLSDPPLAAYPAHPSALPSAALGCTCTCW